MSVGLVILMACAAVASALVLLGRLVSLRRILRNATFIDVGFAIVAGIALHSSIIGVLIAIVGGLVMALVLQIGRMIVRAWDRAAGLAGAPVAGISAFRAAMDRGNKMSPAGAAVQPFVHPYDDGWEPIRGWGEL